MNARIKEQIEQINSGIVPEGYQKSPSGFFHAIGKLIKHLGILVNLVKAKVSRETN